MRERSGRAAAQEVKEMMYDVRWSIPMRRAAMALALVATLGRGAAAEELPPLRIGMAPNYPPLAFKQNGKLKGIEVDFAKRIGQGLVDERWERLASMIDTRGEGAPIVVFNTLPHRSVVLALVKKVAQNGPSGAPLTSVARIPPKMPNSSA